jgi:pantoate--beta-alanine ligase
MRIVNSVGGMQQLARGWKRRGIRVGFVPTMGYLHDGHVSLMEHARRLVGSRGAVVVSIYVNPTQFAAHEDLSRYPRDFSGDCRRCRAAGVDVVFAPEDAEIYAGKEDGTYSTFVAEESLTRVMEGASRPTHFRGVTTIVAKLFNLVLPDVAVFGAKDYQQAATIRRMNQNLNFPVAIEVAPTVRESDGLAMSSRNKYLSAEERSQATVLWECIGKARERVGQGRSSPAGPMRRSLRSFIEKRPACRVDYVEFFDPETLEPVRTVRAGVHMALAVFVGKTRLIDNARL